MTAPPSTYPGATNATRPAVHRPRARRRAGIRWAPGLLLACSLPLAGCASFPSVRPDPPTVSVAGVRPLSIGLTKQRLEFRLRVENPNDFELPLRSLDFVADLAGERIATGRSDERVTIPANGEEIVEVEVEAGIGRLLERMRDMLDNRTLDLDYEVSGFVKLDNWPARIPFDVGGVLENPRGEEPRTDEPGVRGDS